MRSTSIRSNKTTWWLVGRGPRIMDAHLVLNIVCNKRILRTDARARVQSSNVSSTTLTGLAVVYRNHWSIAGEQRIHPGEVPAERRDDREFDVLFLSEMVSRVECIARSTQDRPVRVSQSGGREAACPSVEQHAYSRSAAAPHPRRGSARPTQSRWQLLRQVLLVL